MITAKNAVFRTWKLLFSEGGLTFVGGIKSKFLTDGEESLPHPPSREKPGA